MAEGRIVVIQGGQYGSEAKGMVTAALAKRLKAKWAVRTGAVNAGHTVYHHGFPRRMQQIPTPAWNGDPKCSIVIGPGALIHPDILEYEMNLIQNHFPLFHNRFYVDFRAGVHLPEHSNRSAQSGRHHNIGATGKGCSEALISRISMRGSGGKLYRDCEVGKLDMPVLADTVSMLHSGYDRGDTIIVEGTQGTHLDLYLGPYPFTTHKPTQAATWIQEAGLSPAQNVEVVLVVRTFPIRVAGNSGPMPEETSWDKVAMEINSRLAQKGMPPLVKADSVRQWMEARVEAAHKFDVPRLAYHSDHGDRYWLEFESYSDAYREKYKVALSELHTEAWSLLPGPVQQDLMKLFEMTTVTRKLRRIARWHAPSVKQAVMWNRPKYGVLTFYNYSYPHLWGCTKPIESWPMEDKVQLVKDLGKIYKDTGLFIKYITTGPEDQHMLEVPDGLLPKAAS